MLEQVKIDKIRAAVRFKRLNTYAKIAKNLTFTRFCKILESTTLEEHFLGLLEAQVLKDFGQDGGGVDLSDLVMTENIYFNHYFKWGTEISEAKFTDTQHGGLITGINIISEAVAQATKRAARLGQELGVGVLRKGTGTTLSTSNGNSYKIKCYDGLSLYNAAHPFNYKKTKLGTYCNYHKGLKSSTSPGFLPLGGPFKKHTTGEWIYDPTAEVSIEDGYNNLWLAIAHKATMRMADGETPRYMDPTTLVISKANLKYVDRILEARSIAAKAGSGSTGGGSMDIEGAIKRLGFKEPVVLQELDSAPDLATHSLDGSIIEQWDWFLQCEDDESESEIGAINLGVREPWKVNIYGNVQGTTSQQYELAKRNVVAALGETRVMCGVGEPSFTDKYEAPRAAP